MCFMNKPKVNEKYLKTRLSNGNLHTYVKDVFSQQIRLTSAKTLKIKAFLQKNYGKLGDCTLTSILTVVKYYKPDLDENEVYNYIEKIAEKYLYNGDVYGTIPFFNKAIVKEVFKHFGIEKTVTTKYIKGIGFNENIIINILNQNMPVIISLTKDGRKYYENHTITIIGYHNYKDEKNNNKIMFTVYDN